MTYSRGLYLVTPDWQDTERLLAVTEAALAGGAVMLQYRNKQASTDLRYEQALRLQICCAKYKARFLINDDWRLAKALAADGIHLGRDDGTVVEARAHLGLGAWIGTSCYDQMPLAQKAAAEGASYVAFGAVYPSPTKPFAVRAGIELISQACVKLPLPVACIGGITLENALPLINAGATYLAVISDIYMSSQPEQRAANYMQLFNSY